MMESNVINKCAEKNNICITCLSTDRKLYKMMQTDVINEFKSIGLDMQQGKLCWECRAIINKIVIFKRKAILANEILIGNLKATKFQCLSTLNTKNKDSYDEIILSKIQNEDITHHQAKEVIALKDLDVKLESDSEANYFDETVIEFDSTANLETKVNVNIINEENVYLKKEIGNNNKTILNKVNIKSKSRRIKTKTKNKTYNLKSEKYRTTFINEIDIDLLNSKNFLQYDITEDELLRLREKEKLSSIFTRSKIKCGTCIIPFHNDEELSNHFSNVHCETIGSYMCQICHCRFPELDSYNKHKKHHLTTYKCGMCKYSCLTSNAIEMHMKRNHGKEYSCNTCSKSFNSKGAARYHIKMHNMEECKLCGKQFSDLKLHMISHSKVRTEQCPICQKSLKSKSSLRFHLLTHESSRKDDAYCAECDTYYKNKHIYRMHLNTNAKHTVPDKECDYCRRKFISKFTLAKHINVVHYNKLDHVCHLCGKKFSIAGHLRNHILVHHEGGSKPKKHICDLCGKGFAIKKCLTDHINSHTGARPYKCTSCTAQFGFKSALYMHNRLKHQNGKKGKKQPAVSVAPT